MTSIMYQILLALEFLEVNYILHRDIKADNVTVQVKDGGDITVKLILSASDIDLLTATYIAITRSRI